MIIEYKRGIEILRVDRRMSRTRRKTSILKHKSEERKTKRKRRR